MTNKELKTALLNKLGITHQALSLRVQKIKRKIAVNTAEATYLVAQENNIILDKYLDQEELDRVRSLHQQLSLTTSTSVASPRQGKTTSKPITPNARNARSIVIGKEFRTTDPILAEKKLLEAKEMAAIYPLLYVLENSIREVIDKIMTKKHGPDWFDSQAPKGLKEKVADKMSDENRNSWHQRRGDRPIDYLDFNQLPALMRKIDTSAVPDIIPSLEWFNQFVEEIYKSRCVLCHMNPLDQDNIGAIKLRLSQWQKLINSKKNLIL
jgi:hypothetical protein